MKKHSMPVRIAALLCAVCLLLTGCGKTTVPDDPGEPSNPAPTAEPIAEETQENPTAAPAEGKTSAATQFDTLPADVALPEGSGVYKVLDACPEEFTRRELSDEEIRGIARKDLETARERISTGGDFAAWLIALGGQIYSNVACDENGQRSLGQILPMIGFVKCSRPPLLHLWQYAFLGMICRGLVLLLPGWRKTTVPFSAAI